MKKTYETPSIEVVKFQYRDQVVAASNGFVENSCTTTATHEVGDCMDNVTSKTRI